MLLACNGRALHNCIEFSAAKGRQAGETVKGAGVGGALRISGVCVAAPERTFDRLTTSSRIHEGVLGGDAL